MTTKYYRDESGNYLGGWGEGTIPPQGAIEVPSAPDHASSKWNGEAWLPVQWSREPLLKIVRAGREIALNRLAGIAFAAKENGDPTTVAACLAARQSLLDITKLLAVQAATDDASLTSAIGAAYTAIIAASPPVVIAAFADIQS